MLFVLTGPESTGKSTLAKALAEQLEVPRVDEAARIYLLDKAGYQPSDLLKIALQQQLLEQSAADVAEPSIVIADTDLQVIYIWWQERFGPAPEILRRAYVNQGPRHYLLCDADLNWVPDPLRENPRDRKRLLELYSEDLHRRQLPFSLIQGEGQQRLDCALSAIKAVDLQAPH